MPLVLGHLISTEEAKGYAICFDNGNEIMGKLNNTMINSMIF